MNKYKIGDQFVIEIDEIFENANEEEFYRIKGLNCLFGKASLDSLLQFPNREDANDMFMLTQEEKEYVYNKGLEDAWKFVRKIFDLNNSSMEKVFGFREKRKVFDTLDVQEALAKLEAYEKEQEEIKVGDVVEVAKGTLGIITYANSDIDNYSFVDFAGFTRNDYRASRFKKTGKHIDISSILEQIGGGE